MYIDISKGISNKCGVLGHNIIKQNGNQKLAWSDLVVDDHVFYLYFVINAKSPFKKKREKRN